MSHWLFSTLYIYLMFILFQGYETRTTCTMQRRYSAPSPGIKKKVSSSSAFTSSLSSIISIGMWSRCPPRGRLTTLDSGWLLPSFLRANSGICIILVTLAFGCRIGGDPYPRGRGKRIGILCVPDLSRRGSTNMVWNEIVPCYLYLLLLACFTITFGNDSHEQLLLSYFSRVVMRGRDTRRYWGADIKQVEDLKIEC